MQIEVEEVALRNTLFLTIYFTVTMVKAFLLTEWKISLPLISVTIQSSANEN